MGVPALQQIEDAFRSQPNVTCKPYSYDGSKTCGIKVTFHNQEFGSLLMDICAYDQKHIEMRIDDLMEIAPSRRRKADQIVHEINDRPSYFTYFINKKNQLCVRSYLYANHDHIGAAVLDAFYKLTVYLWVIDEKFSPYAMPREG